MNTRPTVMSILCPVVAVRRHLLFDSRLLCLWEQFFKSYEYRGTEDERNSFFGISLVDLIDGLSVFATSDGLAELIVKCPESKATLNLE
jgi:hypothetical protein